MCCLAGNDFLPHIPVVDIYDGGIDRLLAAYHSLDPAEAGHLVGEDGALALPRWQQLLGCFAQAEAEALLNDAGLGLGSQKQPFRGPGPPTEAWDGLSVLVSYVPAQAKAKDVMVAMGKQGCKVAAAYKVCGRKPRSPTSWLVRLADARSAVMSLVATRRVWSSRVNIEWVCPHLRELEQPPAEPFEAADWGPTLEAAVLETFEYWLSAENLQNDNFLRRHVRSSKDRFVPIRVFTTFNRLRVWLQDIGRIARILKTSTQLEVQGEGEAAKVRAVEDHSVRPDETPEQVVRQQEAMQHLTSGDCEGAVLALRSDYYGRYADSPMDGAPVADNLNSIEERWSRAFLAGIEWVLRYYLHGCSSWSWFYPAHYPPLCASLKRHAAEPLVPPPLDAPFPPELQLLAVLPPQSAGLLPEPLRGLLLDLASHGP